MATWTTMHSAWQCKEARQRSSGISESMQKRVSVFWRSFHFAASSGYGRKRGRHHDQGSLAVRHRELCKTDFDLDAVLKPGVMPHAANVSTRWMAKSGIARRRLLVPVHYSSTSGQAGRHARGRDGVCPRRVQNFCCFHQSFAKAAIVR